MKIIVGALLSLLALFPVVKAQENFAGIYFDSSLPALQTHALKNDLTYLFQTSYDHVDPDLQIVTGMPSVDGPHMYNWLYNRVKYIIGEDYHIWHRRNALTRRWHKFPNTPLPPFMTKSLESFYGVVIMSNTGAELYLRGKRDKILRGIKLDRKDVYATSPRVGILQVGAGLFRESFQINTELNSEANKIKRLATLFHEARHSDGHSEHIGFHHDKCPSGHPLSGLNACETSANGAYTTEAVATKTLLLNCHSCSQEDTTKLQAAVADAYSRVILVSHMKTEAQLLQEIEAYQRVVEFYIEYLQTSPHYEPGIRELARLRAEIIKCEEQLAELRNPKIAEELDPTPEGPYQEVSVEASSRLMKATLNK